MQDQLDALDSIITQLVQRADTSRKDNESLRQQLAATQGELASTQGELAAAQGELANTQAQLTSTQADLATAQADLASTQEELAKSREMLEETGLRIELLIDQLKRDTNLEPIEEGAAAEPAPAEAEVSSVAAPSL